MSFSTDPRLLEGLQDLLKPVQSSESESDDEYKVVVISTKSKICSPAVAGTSEVSRSGLPKEQQLSLQQDQEAVDDWHQFGASDSNLLDSRKVPEYNIVYKQSLQTEDVYLQMCNKTASTASCEEILVSIHLPDEEAGSLQQMDLSVTEKHVNFSSKIYRLQIYLPHSIHPGGNAKWDNMKKELQVCLRMRREYDFVNF